MNGLSPNCSLYSVNLITKFHYILSNLLITIQGVPRGFTHSAAYLYTSIYYIYFLINRRARDKIILFFIFFCSLVKIFLYFSLYSFNVSYLKSLIF